MGCVQEQRPLTSTTLLVYTPRVAWGRDDLRRGYYGTETAARTMTAARTHRPTDQNDGGPHVHAPR